MNKIFCPIPYIGFSIGPKNDGMICSTGNDSLCTIDKNTNLKEIWYGDINEKREQYLKGAIPLGCKRCFVNEEASIKSRRIRFLKFNKQFQFEETKPTLQYLNVNFSNICNLDCVMCSSKYSSKWLENDKLLSKKYSFRKEIKPFLQIDKLPISFIDQINIKELKFVEIKGGEPFVDPGFIYFLKKFIKEKGTSSIHITSNLNILTDEVKKYLSQLPRLAMDVSVDAIGDLYTYIRGNNSSLKKVEENLKFVKEIKNLHELRINITTSPYNMWDSYKVIEWVNNIDKTIKVNWCVLTIHPFYLDPSLVPYELRKKAVQKILHSLNHPDDHHIIDLKMILNYLSQKNPQNDSKEMIKLKRKYFIQWTDEINKIRNMNIYNLIPNLKKVINEI
jgi:pyruvate-formate lyase-activating enzyme